MNPKNEIVVCSPEIPERVELPEIIAAFDNEMFNVEATKNAKTMFHRFMTVALANDVETFQISVNAFVAAFRVLAATKYDFETVEPNIFEFALAGASHRIVRQFEHATDGRVQNDLVPGVVAILMSLASNYTDEHE